VYVEGRDGSALLDNCTLRDLKYGVHVNQFGNATMRNGTSIKRFSNAGVIVNFGEAVVSDTTMVSDGTANSQGVAVRGSTITITDVDIYDVRAEGVELADGATGTLTDCVIRNCTVGVRMDDSTADLLRCSMSDCLDGLNLLLSNPTVTDCSLVDNFNGVSSKDCTDGYTLETCVIGRNSQYGVYAIGKGLSETGTVWTHLGEDNGIARVIQWWSLDVNVTDKDGIPVSSAEVVVRFANGTKVTNQSTDALGSVRDIELEGHRVGNDGTVVEQPKYDVRIEKGKRFAEKDVLMDRDKTLTVALGEEPSITDSGWFWAIPIIVVLLVVVIVGYWWFRIR
jgi:hypothetical protein